MARVVAAFGTSHSTMQFSSRENWQAMFDHVDCRAPIYDFQGKPRSFEELLKATPPSESSKISAAAQAERHQQTVDAMDRLQSAIAAAKLDVLVIVGDDQREVFGDECRPAIAVYYGDSIRNGPAPAEPTDSWYFQDQRKRMEDKHERFYPCHAGLGTYLAAGLTDRGFDITAMKTLKGDQSEGHAYSFIHRRFMRNGPIPIVPVMLNTYYPPNQPSPRRCFPALTCIGNAASRAPTATAVTPPPGTRRGLTTRPAGSGACRPARRRLPPAPAATATPI